MRKGLTFCLMLFCCLYMEAQPQWFTMGQTINNGRIEDICFTDRETGWAVSAGGQIFYTNDGAVTWELQYGNTYYLRSVGFADSQLGFAGTLDNVFLKTENGGADWIDITAQLPIVPSGICGMQWLDDQHFFAVGAWFEPAFLIRSDDRGESWEALDLSMYANALVDVHFISSDTGFVCGKGTNGGIILYTTNGGEDWEELYSTGNPGDFVWKLQFIDEQHVVASVQTFGFESSLPYSNDGGLTWIEKPVPDGNAQGVGFVTPAKGWIGGYNPGFLATENAGDDWEYVPFGGNYNRFQVFDSTFAYAAGHQVYKYADTAMVVAQTSRETVERRFDPLLAVTPNPAFQQASIFFQLPKVNNVDLNLYDSKGALVQRVFNGRLPAGTHRFPIETTHGNGYFLVGLQLNEGLFSVPIVVR